MAIPIPITRTKIATVPWGIPLTNAVNASSAITGRFRADSLQTVAGTNGTIPKGSTLVDLTPVLTVPSTLLPGICSGIIKLDMSIAGVTTLTNLAFSLTTGAGATLGSFYYTAANEVGAVTLTYPFLIPSGVGTFKLMGRNSGGSSSDVTGTGSLNILTIPTP